MATLSKNMNMMVIQLGEKFGKDKDAKPPIDVKMGANANSTALTKTAKKEKEWCQTLSVGCVNLKSTICPIVTVKSFDSYVNHKIHVELHFHADTSVAGSYVLVMHNHECYIDVFGYDSKSWHKNITTVDAAVAYDNPQTGYKSVLLINQAIS